MTASVQFDFSGSHVLVTGGSNGIGLATARAFRESNAEVTITGRGASAADYEHDLTGLEYRCVEMTEDADVNALIASTGKLDILVNNAGGSYAMENEWNPEIFEKAIKLALFGSFRLAVGLKKRIAASDIEGGGSVLNMASMSAFRAVPMVPGYGAAKAGIVQMTKNMGVAWALDNVRVNAVAPGIIMTNMMAGLAGTPIEQEEIAKTPMKRWGRPEEIASAYLFLASPAARFMTGQTICVDGGYSIA